MRYLCLLLILLSVQASACLNDRDTDRTEDRWSHGPYPASAHRGDGPLLIREEAMIDSFKLPSVFLALLVGGLFGLNHFFGRGRRR